MYIEPNIPPEDSTYFFIHLKNCYKKLSREHGTKDLCINT